MSIQTVFKGGTPVTAILYDNNTSTQSSANRFQFGSGTTAIDHLRLLINGPDPRGSAVIAATLLNGQVGGVYTMRANAERYFDFSGSDVVIRRVDMVVVGASASASGGIVTSSAVAAANVKTILFEDDWKVQGLFFETLIPNVTANRFLVNYVGFGYA